MTKKEKNTNNYNCRKLLVVPISEIKRMCIIEKTKHSTKKHTHNDGDLSKGHGSRLRGSQRLTLEQFKRQNK